MGRLKVVPVVKCRCETGGKIAPGAIKVAKRKAALELAHAAGERAMAALRKKRNSRTEVPEEELDELQNAEREEGEEEEKGEERVAGISTSKRVRASSQARRKEDIQDQRY
jgi:hypothetical protein